MYVVPVPLALSALSGGCCIRSHIHRCSSALTAPKPPAPTNWSNPPHLDCHSLAAFAGTAVDSGVILSAAFPILGETAFTATRDLSLHLVTFRYLITYKTFSYPLPPRGPIPLSPSPLSIATTPLRRQCLPPPIPTSTPPHTLSTRPLPLSFAPQLTARTQVSPPEYLIKALEEGENAPFPPPSKSLHGNPRYPLPYPPIPTRPHPRSRHMRSPRHKRRSRCAM